MLSISDIVVGSSERKINDFWNEEKKKIINDMHLQRQASESNQGRITEEMLKRIDNDRTVMVQLIDKNENLARNAVICQDRMRVLAVKIGQMEQDGMQRVIADNEYVRHGTGKFKRKFQWAMYDGDGLLIKRYDSWDELRNDERGFADYLKKTEAWQKAHKEEYDEKQEEVERQQDRDEQRAEKEEDQRDQRKQARSDKQRNRDNDLHNVDNNNQDRNQEQIHDKQKRKTANVRKLNKGKEEVKISFGDQLKTREKQIEQKAEAYGLTEDEAEELEYIQDELAKYMQKNHITVTHRHFVNEEPIYTEFNWKGDIVNRDRTVRHSKKQYCQCKSNEVCRTCWSFHIARLNKLGYIGNKCDLPIEEQTRKLEGYIKDNRLEKKVIIKPKLVGDKNVSYIERHYVPGEKKKENKKNEKDDKPPWEDEEYKVDRHGVNTSAAIMKQRNPREHPEIIITKSAIGVYPSGTQVMVFNTTSNMMFTAAHWLRMGVGKDLKDEDMVCLFGWPNTNITWGSFKWEQSKNDEKKIFKDMMKSKVPKEWLSLDLSPVKLKVFNKNVHIDLTTPARDAKDFRYARTTGKFVKESTRWNDDLQNQPTVDMTNSSLPGYSGSPVMESEGCCVGIAVGGDERNERDNVMLPFDSDLIQWINNSKNL